MHALALLLVFIGCMVAIRIINRKGTKVEPPVVSPPNNRITTLKPEPGIASITATVTTGEERLKNEQTIKDVLQLLNRKVTENIDLESAVEKSTNREMRYKAALLAITKQYGWSETQINEVLALIEYD